ncbi:DNA polymerase [Cyanobium usitatum]|uniref:DNA polymerase n=1 Tax=Cyanobium usitatum TaxID=2304190 RepID=UPI002AD38710|nr:DNA polymerase [Cyanobium usitatum]
MAPTSTQQSPLHTAVLAALQEHGTGRWPAGVAAAIAEQVGSTPRSVSTTKCLLAKGRAADPAEPPVPEVEQQLGLGLPTANGVHQVGDPEADAQRAARGSKRKTKAAASAPNDNGAQAAPAAAVTQVSAEEPAPPIPADAADPVAEALAELQHNDAIGLQLVVDGKAPSSAACRAAGLPGTWRLTRWPQIRGLDPEQLLANQQEQASTDAALEQGMADGVAQAQAERAERTQLCERHRQILLASAITEERISLWETVADPRDLPPALQSWGKKAVPCMATTWLTVSGALVPQIRVDTPIPLKNGRPARYLFPKDSGGIVGTDAAFERDWGNAHVPMLMVEGTKQFQAAASTINPEVPFAIPFGLAGCWGWSSDLKPSADLLALPVEGRDVLVAFDADVASNWMVWEAARRLEKYLLGELMARSVRFLINPGTGGASDGLDDLLGRQPTLERRVKLLRHLIDTAIEHKVIKAPKRPAKLTAFFDGANFKPASCLDYLSGENHLAMSGDQSVAVYQGGVFHNGTSLWWTRLVSETLGDDYRPEFEASVTKIALAQLKTEGLVIPFQQPRPVINFQNCLLEVRELLQRDHTPEHLTLIQLPHRWNPAAECPVFLRWVEQVAPGQLDGLLDVCCQMLDLSEWPRLIVFLTGPTRSGKSTWIRILNALVGAHLRANVSLHDLSRSGQDKFATSSLFGKVLNTFADLSAEDLQDLSMVKVLTGGDEFEAQRKHGHRFQMRNQAMLVFSANTVPATSESSGAFLARVAHFEFPHSFQGREDKTIEERILRDEIPGVLRLMVEALHKRKQRGNFLPLDEGRQQAFAERTDRVRMFLAERTAPGKKGPRCIPRSELYQLFCSWVEEEHGGKAGRILGKHKFNERVRLAGVGEFKPEGGSWRWDRVEVDPETAEPAPPETAEPGDGVDKSGFDVDKGPASALSGPKLPSKTAEGKTAVVEPVLVGGEAGSTAVSAVSPYCTTPIQNTQLKLKPAQWVETADTAEELTEAAAVAPALPAVVAPVPRPYTGPARAGLTYIAAADQLPDPATVPLLVGFDLETFNRRTDLLRHKASLFPFLGGEIRLAQLHADGHTLVIDVALVEQATPGAAIAWLAQIVRNPERTLVGHNLLFEATHLIAAGIRPLCRWWDSMLASQTLGDYPEHTLEAAAANYLGTALDKELQTSDWGNGLTEAQLRYAALDAEVVLPLREALHAELERTGQVEVHRLDCQVICPAADGQARGLAIDTEVLAKVEAEAAAALAPLLDQLYAALEPHGLPPRGKTQPHKGNKFPAAMEAATGLQLRKREPDKTGEWVEKVSCSADVVELFKGVPLIDLLLQIRDLETAVQQAAQLRRDVVSAGGRTYPNYNILGANTGRMTTCGQIGAKASAPSDTEVFGPTADKAGQPKPVKLPQIGANFQGFQALLKKALCTGDPAKVLIDADWDGQEIRLQASPRLYNDGGYRREVLLGEDSHTKMALLLFDLPRPEGVVRKLVGCTDAQRAAAKPAGFSLPYGCAAASLQTRLSAAQGQPVRRSKAEAIYRQWHRDHREVSAQMDHCGNNVVRERRSIAGRRICSRGNKPGPDGRLPVHRIGRTSGANWPVQSSGRDLLADALGDLWLALDAYPGARIVGLIHDEVLVEAPRELAEQVRDVVVACMSSARLQDKYLGDVPLKASAKIGDSWGEVH